MDFSVIYYMKSFVKGRFPVHSIIPVSIIPVLHCIDLLKYSYKLVFLSWISFAWLNFPWLFQSLSICHIYLEIRKLRPHKKKQGRLDMVGEYLNFLSWSTCLQMKMQEVGVFAYQIWPNINTYYTLDLPYLSQNKKTSP